MQHNVELSHPSGPSAVDLHYALQVEERKGQKGEERFREDKEDERFLIAKS